MNFGDTNVIVVKVDNLRQPNSRWYSGSGIYRNVSLTTVNKVHVDNWGTFVSTPLVTPTLSLVKVETSIANNADSSIPVSIRTTIKNREGKRVAGKVVNATIPAGNVTNHSPSKVTQNIEVNFPRWWTLDRPYLYTAVTNVMVNGKVVDTYETPFGIRAFKFDAAKGFYLNGKSGKILGVCNHHDLGSAGRCSKYKGVGAPA